MRCALSLFLVGLSSLSTVTSCHQSKPKNEATAVADRFVDYYFVEANQEKAMTLATGPAKDMLKKEIEDVKAIRAGGYTPAEAENRTFYDRTYKHIDKAAGRARFVYDLRIKQGAGHGELKKHVLVSVDREDKGQWRVFAFSVEEGPAPSAAKGSLSK